MFDLVFSNILNKCFDLFYRIPRNQSSMDSIKVNRGEMDMMNTWAIRALEKKACTCSTSKKNVSSKDTDDTYKCNMRVKKGQ